MRICLTTAIVACACSSLLARGSREIEFKGVGDLSLYGTLQWPDDPAGAKHPAVLIVAGSGPTDRDGNSAMLPEKIDTLKHIAQGLSARGVASLRFDKRVAGKSVPTTMPAGEKMEAFVAWDSFVGDVAAAHRAMSDQPEVAADRTAILGHSEGGLLTLDLITRSDGPHARAVVLAATPGRTGQVLVGEQIKRQLQRQGAAPGLRDKIVTSFDQLAGEIVRDGKTSSPIFPGLAALFPPNHGKFLESFLGFDPIPAAGKTHLPILILQGEFDAQVSPADDAAKLHEALLQREKCDQTIAIQPGLSHNFKHVADANQPGFSGEIPARTLDALADWLKSRLK